MCSVTPGGARNLKKNKVEEDDDDGDVAGLNEMDDAIRES